VALAIVIFVAALALIASERVDRTKVALLGGVAVLLTQTIERRRSSRTSRSRRSTGTRSGCSWG
jgi:Na+/H+ antiporter NhaD/arsenite permease-like protein